MLTGRLASEDSGFPLLNCTGGFSLFASDTFMTSNLERLADISRNDLFSREQQLLGDSCGDSVGRGTNGGVGLQARCLYGLCIGNGG